LEAIEALEIPRFIIDGRREVLTMALLVCDAGNLIMLMAVGENPIDDLSSDIAIGAVSSASKQFNNAFARR
jgi:hypothetical protein